MIKHIILWNLKAEYTPEQKAEIKQKIKTELEGLMGEIEGLLDIRVQTEHLESATADLMLDSTFENEAALQYYAAHEKHVAVADTYVRPYTALRSCMDYEI